MLAQSFCADLRAQIFGAQCQSIAQIFAQIFRRFFFDVLALQNRGSGVTQKSAQNLRKNLQRPNGLSPEGSLLHLGCLEQTDHHPPGPSTQGEHVSVHYGTLGSKGLLVFATRFFEKKHL